MAASGYPRENTRLFSPFKTETNEKEAPSWNEPIQNLATEFGARIDWFPYIGYGAFNPDDIRHTTLLVGRDMLRSVGSSFTRQLVKRTIVRPNTIRDYK